MKRILFLLALVCLDKVLHAQYVYTIKADSVKITNTCDTAELIIENHTQTVPGFLYNKGRGRTEFRRGLVKIIGNKYVVGGDTLDLSNVWLQGGNAFGTAGVLGTTDNNDLRLFTNNTEKIHVTTAGRVGIGTSTPLAKLHIVDTIGTSNAQVLVSANTNAFPNYQIINTNTGISAGAGMLMFNNANQAFQYYMGSTNNAFVPSGALIRMTGTGGINIVNDNGPIAFGKSPYIGANEFARFLNNGNFGIGTLTPQVKLHVIGKGIFTDTLTATTMDVTDNSNRVATTAFVKNATGAPALSVVAASAADITATAGALTRLPDLAGAGSHSVILPAASLYSGQRIYLWNMNSSANSWTFSSSITLPNGTTTTSITNQSTIELISDGAVWLKWN
jgi:hypothetical protein